MAEQKETIIFEFEVEQGGAIAELEKTKKSIIGLKEEQQQLNKAYKDGNISVDEYAQESVRVDQVLKKQTKTYSDLTHQVQGTKSMTDQLKGSFQQLAPGVNSSIEGFKGMAKAALSFIATPIGAVLAAVAAVLAVVVAALKRSEPALDFFENIINKITTGIDFFLENLKAIGSVLGNVVIGNFAKAAEGAGKLAKGFAEAQKQAQLYLDVTRELEDKSARVRVETAGLENQIKALIIASKNRNNSIEETNSLLDQAAKLEKELVDKRAELANQESTIGIKQIALKRDLKQLDEETLDAFVNRLIESEKLSKEEKDQIASLYEKRAEAASAGLALEEKIQNTRDAALDKDLARIQKLDEERQKAFEAEVKRNQDLDAFNEERRIAQQDQDAADLETWAENYKSKQELELELDAELAAEKITIEDDYIEQVGEIQTSLSEDDKRRAIETFKLKQELMKKGLSEKQAEAIIHAKVEQGKLNVTESTLSQAAGLFKKNTVAYKVAGSAEALINTYSGATTAYKTTLEAFPAPYNAVLAAVSAGVAVAAGLKNVAEINGVAMAGGGSFTTKGPTLLLVGDNPGGRERVNVTPLSGKGQTRVFGNGAGIAMAGGGSIDGSILAASSTRNLDTQFAFQDSLNNQPQVVLDYSEFTRFTSKVQFKENLTTA